MCKDSVKHVSRPEHVYATKRGQRAEGTHRKEGAPGKQVVTHLPRLSHIILRYELNEMQKLRKG